MTWAQLATFNIVLIVAIASPGPAMLMATQTSLSAERTAGIAVGAGLGLMAAIWTMMAFLGFGVVFELFPFLYVGAQGRGGCLSSVHRVQDVEECRRPCQGRDQADRARIPAGVSGESLQSEIRAVRRRCSGHRFPGGTRPGRQHRHRRKPLPCGNRFLDGARLRHEHASGREALHAAKIYIDRAAAAVLGALGVRILLGR